MVFLTWLLIPLAWGNSAIHFRATPKTMNQAIANGHADWEDAGRKGAVEDYVRLAVLDFLAQRFAVAAMKHPRADDVILGLFADIKGENCGAALTLSAQQP